MKLYAVYWKGEEHMLETGGNTWWKAANMLGSLKDAAIFTEEELLSVTCLRSDGVVVEIDV